MPQSTIAKRVLRAALTAGLMSSVAAFAGQHGMSGMGGMGGMGGMH